MATAPRKTPARSAGNQRRAPARRPAARKPAVEGPPSLTAAHVKGFLAGAIAGVLIGAGGVVYLTKESAELPASLASNDTVVKEAKDPKPRFDFYTVLPNQNLDLGADIEPAELTSSRDDNDLYVLQAGSFRQEKDADQRRGELALLGLEAKIERTTGDNGVWYRVYIGPFENRSAMAKARSVTAQQSIDTLLLKRPRNP